MLNGRESTNKTIQIKNQRILTPNQHTQYRPNPYGFLPSSATDCTQNSQTNNVVHSKKASALETLEKNNGNLDKTAKEMKCTTKNIQDWFKQKDQINDACNKWGKRRLGGAVRKLFPNDIDTKVNKLNYITGFMKRNDLSYRAVTHRAQQNNRIYTLSLL